MSREQFLQMRGQTMVDQSGEKVGTIDEIYLDAETNQPEWALVKTGLLGSRSSFVPLEQASVSGDEVVVPFTKEQVKDAPSLDAGQKLPVEQEAELYRHYSLNYPRRPSDSGLREDAESPAGDPSDDTRMRALIVHRPQ